MIDKADKDVPYERGEIDVLVVASLWPENSPLVIHEAWMAGVPVVGAEMGGVADLVSDGRDGLLYDGFGWRGPGRSAVAGMVGGGVSLRPAIAGLRRRAGEAAGLTTVAFTRQALWLTACGIFDDLAEQLGLLRDVGEPHLPL